MPDPPMNPPFSTGTNRDKLRPIRIFHAVNPVARSFSPRLDRNAGYVTLPNQCRLKLGTTFCRQGRHRSGRNDAGLPFQISPRASRGWLQRLVGFCVFMLMPS